MAEQLTPEELALHKEIRKKVDILKFVRKHVRLAGVVVAFAGSWAHNTTLFVAGLVIYAVSYTASIGLMEDINILIWDRPDEPKEEKTEE